MDRSAQKKWDKANMTVVGCRITKAKAQEFKDACAALGIVPNQVIKQAIEETISSAIATHRSNKKAGA